ncbi:MAG: TetR/AcrR family transcriptional regulator [Deltaproteobacteria bacterium]|nr:TetR/AcrR family transcriptional regulator [Nannocystaceae bacterium]
MLEAALALIGEQGYAGASLRKLAAMVGMAQPSLYHYFTSKEDLVEQLIETFAGDMLSLGPMVVPTELEQVPEMVRDLTFSLYQHDTHPLFVRALFAISRSHPRWGKLLREIFVDRVEQSMRMLAHPFVQRGDIDEQDAVFLARMMISAIGLKLMEERVLFEARELGPDVHAYGDFVVATMREVIQTMVARRRARGDTPS